MDNFVLSVSDELWASIYVKRKQCIIRDSCVFDAAAKINQHGLPWRNMAEEYQDDAVREIFRQMVDHIATVGCCLVHLCTKIFY